MTRSVTSRGAGDRVAVDDPARRDRRATGPGHRRDLATTGRRRPRRRGRPRSLRHPRPGRRVGTRGARCRRDVARPVDRPGRGPPAPGAPDDVAEGATVAAPDDDRTDRKAGGHTAGRRARRHPSRPPARAPPRRRGPRRTAPRGVRRPRRLVRGAGLRGVRVDQLLRRARRGGGRHRRPRRATGAGVLPGAEAPRVARRRCVRRRAPPATRRRSGAGGPGAPGRWSPRG